MASENFQVFGLFLILISAAVVFTRIIAWVFGKNQRQIRLGIEMLMFFSVTYIFSSSSLEFLSLGHLTADIQNITALLWWLIIAYILDKTIRHFVWNDQSQNDIRHVPKLFKDGTTALIYAASIMIVMHFVYDEPITAVMATSGAAAFIIGFSAQSTLGDVFAGLSLNASKTLRVGDYLEIDGIYGCVHDINWRGVSLHNPHTDSLYVFPNSVVAQSVVLNYSAPTERFKNTVNFVVEFSAPPDEVTRIVLNALKTSRYVFRDPAPDMNVMGFTDLGMEFRIRYFFDGDDPWWEAQAEICSAIWSSMRRHGYRLSIDRHKLLSGDEMDLNPWVTSPGPVDAIEFTDLASIVPILSDLPEKELSILAGKATRGDYSPPECIFLEGDDCASVFVLAQGELLISRIEPDGMEVTVGDYEAGDIFGVSGFIENQSRTHRVQALGYCVVYEIDRAAVETCMSTIQALAKEFTDLAEKRQSSYNEAAKVDREERRHKEHAKHKLHLIRSLKSHVHFHFNKGMFASMARSILPGRSEKSVVKATMAASALVACNGGHVDDTQRLSVIEALEEIGFLKHMNRKVCLKFFDQFAHAITENNETGAEKALQAIRPVSNNEKAAHMVVAVCHSIHGAGGKLDDAEHDEIVRIANILNVSPDPKDINKAMK